MMVEVRDCSVVVTDVIREVTRENSRLSTELSVANDCLTQVKAFFGSLSDTIEATLTSNQLKLYRQAKHTLDSRAGQPKTNVTKQALVSVRQCFDASTSPAKPSASSPKKTGPEAIEAVKPAAVETPQPSMNMEAVPCPAVGCTQGFLSMSAFDEHWTRDHMTFNFNTSHKVGSARKTLPNYNRGRPRTYSRQCLNSSHSTKTKCFFCPVLFDTVEEMHNHLEQTHHLIKCVRCGLGVVSTEQSLALHHRRCTGQRSRR